MYRNTYVDNFHKFISHELSSVKLDESSRDTIASMQYIYIYIYIVY